MATAHYSRSVVGFAGLWGLRHDLTVWLAQGGVARLAIDDLVLAIVELTTNGVEAAPSAEARVDLVHAPDSITAVIANDGPPFHGLSSTPTDPFATRGRGLFLAGALSESLTFDASDGVTTATLFKELGSARAEVASDEPDR